MTIKTTQSKGETGLPRYFAGRVRHRQSRWNMGASTWCCPMAACSAPRGRNPGPVAELHIHNPDIFARLIREGDLGFCEAYLDGWWSTPDLQAFMDLVHADNEEVYDGFPACGWCAPTRSCASGCSRIPSAGEEEHLLPLRPGQRFLRAVARRHDDLFLGPVRHRAGKPGGRADAKYASMVDQMGAQPGDHVLEIGCGWGGFAEYAAKERGLKVTGLTISKEQHDYAVARIARRGCRTGWRSSCRTTATSGAPMTASPRSRCSRRWARNTGRSISTPCASGSSPAHGRPADHHRAGPALGDLPQGRRFHPEIHLPRRHAARPKVLRAEVERRGSR
jgi:cyclopropane-fatty-acyl-phospholipid synthase